MNHSMNWITPVELLEKVSWYVIFDLLLLGENLHFIIIGTILALNGSKTAILNLNVPMWDIGLNGQMNGWTAGRTNERMRLFPLTIFVGDNYQWNYHFSTVQNRHSNMTIHMDRKVVYFRLLCIYLWQYQWAYLRNKQY